MTTTVRPEIVAKTVPDSRSHGRRAPQRVALQRKAFEAYRRHFSRGLTRVTALIVADVVALLGLRVLVSWVTNGPLAASYAALVVDRLFVVEVMEGPQFIVALLAGQVVAGAYGQGDRRRDVWRLFVGAAIATTLVLWSTIWSGAVAVGVLRYVVVMAVVLGVLIGERLLVDRVVSRVLPPRHRVERTIFVGDPADPEVRVLQRRLATDPRMAFVGWVGPARSTDMVDDFLGVPEEIERVLQTTDVDTVVVCGHFADKVFKPVVEVCTLAGCRVLSVSRLDGLGRVHPTLVWHKGIPLVQLTVPSLKAQQLLLKRIIDLVGAAIGLAVLSPFLLLVAVAIRLDSAGPVFFSHERVGFGGRTFRMLKFRTMRDGADNEKSDLAHLNHTGDPRLFKIPNDPRVTRVGALLRRWSIDELPQLWNVLKGDMSLVGPRPFFQSDLADYSDHHFVRLGAKPGITGLWQVNGRSSVVDFEEVVRLDREYIDRWGLWLDFQILGQTLPAVVRRTGAF